MAGVVVVATLILGAEAMANPANKLALKRSLAEFLPAKLNDCATCHVKGGDHSAESLKEIPHNAFGERLRELGETAGDATGIAIRLQQVEREDSDGDGADNISELILGFGPGDASDTPSPHALETVEARLNAFRTSPRNRLSLAAV